MVHEIQPDRQAYTRLTNNCAKNEVEDCYDEIVFPAEYTSIHQFEDQRKVCFLFMSRMQKIIILFLANQDATII